MGVDGNAVETKTLREAVVPVFLFEVESDGAEVDGEDVLLGFGVLAEFLVVLVGVFVVAGTDVEMREVYVSRL